MKAESGARGIERVEPRPAPQHPRAASAGCVAIQMIELVATPFPYVTSKVEDTLFTSTAGVHSHSGRTINF